MTTPTPAPVTPTLSISADKATYKVGDPITVDAPADGYGAPRHCSGRAERIRGERSRIAR